LPKKNNYTQKRLKALDTGSTEIKKPPAKAKKPPLFKDSSSYTNTKSNLTL